MVSAAGASDVCVLTVVGVPQPQGSKTAYVRNGRAVVTEGRTSAARENVAEWRRAVSDAARAWVAKHDHAPWDCALEAEFGFWFSRPSSLPKREQYARRKPDLSKLIRAAEDALTGIVYVDDARLVRIVATKAYTAGAPGARISVRPFMRALDGVRVGTLRCTS